MEEIYFTKVEFRESYADMVHSILLLNILEKELSYQVYRWKRQMPGIRVPKTYTFGDIVEVRECDYPAKIIKNGKTGFADTLIRDNFFEDEIEFSYGIKLTEEQIRELLPYCNALDFEPFRDKKMKFEDEGRIGYRDEAKLRFRGMSDSYLPLLELPMDYYYDEKHIWPSEKLYRYLLITFFSDKNNKKLRGHRPCYGASSLFI